MCKQAEGNASIISVRLHWVPWMPGKDAAAPPCYRDLGCATYKPEGDNHPKLEKCL